MSFTLLRKALRQAKKTKKNIDAELKEGLIPTPKEAKGKNVQSTTQAKAQAKRIAKDIAAMEKTLKGPDSAKATQQGLRFAKKYELQEGMGLDAVTGRSNRAAASVDAGEAGKVTKGKKSVNNFAADQRVASPGMQARGKQDDKAFKDIMKEREAGNTKKEKELRAKQKQVEAKRDKADKAAEQSRRRKLSGSRKKKPVDDFAVAINRKTGEINEASFNRLTKNQQEALLRDIRARFTPARVREIMAKLEQKSPAKAGESGVGARKGGNRDTRGASANPTRKSDGATGRGGPLMNKGGKVTKRATGAHDYRMNKGGLLLSSVDNRKKK